MKCITSVLVLLSTLAVSACDAAPKNTSPVATVNLTTVFKNSTLSEQEMAHLKEVKAILMKGQEDGHAMRGVAGTESAQKAQQADEAALNNQWLLEQAAAREAVLRAIREASDAVLSENHYSVVADSESLLAASADVDVTGEVVKHLRSRTVDFGSLPVVTLKQPAP